MRSFNQQQQRLHGTRLRVCSSHSGVSWPQRFNTRTKRHSAACARSFNSSSSMQRHTPSSRPRKRNDMYIMTIVTVINSIARIRTENASVGSQMIADVSRIYAWLTNCNNNNKQHTAERARVCMCVGVCKCAPKPPLAVQYYGGICCCCCSLSLSLSPSLSFFSLSPTAATTTTRVVLPLKNSFCLLLKSFEMACTLRDTLVACVNCVRACARERERDAAAPRMSFMHLSHQSCFVQQIIYPNICVLL